MLQELINHINKNPKQRRFALIAALSFASAGLAFLVLFALDVNESRASNELVSAFTQLAGQALPVLPARSDLSSALTTTMLVTGLILFAFLATLAGYSLKKAGRIVSLLQLLLIGAILEAIVAHVLSHETRPITLFLATVFGLLSGIALKRFDDHRRAMENQYYELKLRNRELTESRLALVKQDETERRLLAADLHDQVLNDLKALKQKIDNYSDSRDEQLPEDIRKLLNQAMNEIRNVMDSLSPVVLEHFGLGSAVEECLEKGAARSGFNIEFTQEVTTDRLKQISMVEQQLLYRLVQESITNICKHAAASVVSATLLEERQDLVIRIADDGKGMDLSRSSDASRGLKYMRLRVGLIGGAIAWQSPDPKTGRGTVVEIRCPIKNGE